MLYAVPPSTPRPLPIPHSSSASTEPRPSVVPAQVPLPKQYIHAIQDTGSSQSQSAELAPCPERKRRVAAPKHPERMRADNQPADTKQGTRAETSARCRNTALRKSMAKGQLTRICRHTGRPGKASNPKNTGRKTQSAANYPQFLFRLEIVVERTKIERSKPRRNGFTATPGRQRVSPRRLDPPSSTQLS